MWKELIDWLIGLPPYQNVLLSLGILFVGMIAVIWICGWMFKKMDEAERKNP